MRFHRRRRRRALTRAGVASVAHLPAACSALPRLGFFAAQSTFDARPRLFCSAQPARSDEPAPRQSPPHGGAAAAGSHTPAGHGGDAARPTPRPGQSSAAAMAAARAASGPPAALRNGAPGVYSAVLPV
jgi:hypothetical protein